jgi:hypothetical protein
MKISQIIKTLKIEEITCRTPKGRPLTEMALDGVRSTLTDTKNHGIDAIKCLNCGIILSSLLVGDGCVNCGAIDMSTEIRANDVVDTMQSVELGS